MHGGRLNLSTTFGGSINGKKRVLRGHGLGHKSKLVRILRKNMMLTKTRESSRIQTGTLITLQPLPATMNGCVMSCQLIRTTELGTELVLANDCG